MFEDCFLLQKSFAGPKVRVFANKDHFSNSEFRFWGGKTTTKNSDLMFYTKQQRDAASERALPLATKIHKKQRWLICFLCKLENMVKLETYIEIIYSLNID